MGLKQWNTKRQLTASVERAKTLRIELAELDEQVRHFEETEEETASRALVSDSLFDAADEREHRSHADVWRKRRAKIVAELAELSVTQDQLLDRLSGQQ
jgi:predicted  nucleic acid-binding Zn-ribbon protein